MMEVIQGSSAGYKDLTKADRLAIAKYLKSIEHRTVRKRAAT